MFWWLLPFPVFAVDLERCDFPRVDGSNLTWDEFAFNGRPVLVYGLGVPELPALPLDMVVQISNGRNEEGHRRYLTANLSRYLQEAETLRLDDDRSSLPTIFLSDLLTKVQRDLWQNLQLPRLMDGFTARPILSIGVQNSGEDFHNHEETWLWLAQGLKAWWIADGHQLPNLAVDPCRLLSKDKAGNQRVKQRLHFCVQRPGEAIFFGDGWAHGTCNLKQSLGLGAQGRQKTAPLLQAAQSGQLKRLEEAIQQKQQDAPFGRSAMHAATVWGHVEAAKMLLKSGAQIRKDVEGLEPIHLAALHGHVSMVEFLSGSFEGNRFELTQRAAMQGHVEVMRSLTSKDLRQSDFSAIHFAAKGGHIPAVDFLVGKRAALEEKSKAEGLTALHFAASQGHAELVQHLIHLGAQLEAKDSRGLEPIHLAVHIDSARVVREMMDLGHFPEDLGHFAAEGGRLKALRAILMKHPHAATQVDRRGFCPLHMAAMAGHSAAIQLLVDQGASPSQPEAAGFTSLHFAAKGGHKTAVKRLLELQADVTWSSKDGTLPRDVASRMNHRHLLEVLETKNIKGGKGTKTEL